MSQTRFEPKDWNNRFAWGIVIGTFALFIFGVFAGGVFHYIFEKLQYVPAPMDTLARTPKLPAQPRLQVEEKQELQAWKAAQNEQLHGYGWVDKNQGVAHIPIEKAIELTAGRLPVGGQGLPARQQDAPKQ